MCQFLVLCGTRVSGGSGMQNKRIKSTDYFRCEESARYNKIETITFTSCCPGEPNICSVQYGRFLMARRNRALPNSSRLCGKRLTCPYVCRCGIGMLLWKEAPLFTVGGCSSFCCQQWNARYFAQVRTAFMELSSPHRIVRVGSDHWSDGFDVAIRKILQGWKFHCQIFTLSLVQPVVTDWFSFV